VEKTIETIITASENTYAKVQMSLYTHLSGRHLFSLNYMCKRLREIEDTENYDKIHGEEHTALSHSAVLLSVCMLESNINELFCDSLFSPKNLSDIDCEQILLLKNMWKLDIPRTSKYSVLNKYTIALTLLQRPVFNKGEATYQDVDLLIKLRNQLTHSEAEITTNDENDKTKSAKLYNQLGAKFKAKKGTESIGNPFFPDKCFGYGCAEWSALSAINFIKEFYVLAGMKSKLEFLSRMIEGNNLSLFM